MAMLRQIARTGPSFLRWTVHPHAALASRGLKAHTGIAGLEVDPNARENLKMHLEQVLEAIKIIPEEAEYRRNVEITINDKLNIVNSDITDEEAEDRLDAQLEQYIKFTQDELSLIPKMAGEHLTRACPAHGVCLNLWAQLNVCVSPQYTVPNLGNFQSLLMSALWAVCFQIAKAIDTGCLMQSGNRGMYPLVTR